MQQKIPDGFLSFSDAVKRLSEGIWGGIRAPAPVRAVKREFGRLSVCFGAWREQAGELLADAATQGRLSVHVFAGKLDSRPTLVAPNVLARMIRVRGTFPDHPVRASMKTTQGDARLLRLLENGILLVATEEFDDWYRAERRKGRWPSQRSRLKRRPGRPSIQTEPLRAAVLKVSREEKGLPITQLRRRLIARGITDVPSRDTLRRLSDQLYVESGEPALRRKRRIRRNKAGVKTH